VAGTAANDDRDMAGAVLIGGRVVVWLVRHPMASVFVFLAVVATFTASALSLFLGPSSDVPRASTDALVEPDTLPTPTQHPPRDRVDAVHKALHALGRACESPLAQRRPDAVRRPVALIEAFAVAYPSGGFQVDGEPGTTLALLIVVRYELQSCDPSLIPEVEGLIPAKHLGR
jgi:hypothetical protein